MTYYMRQLAKLQVLISDFPQNVNVDDVYNAKRGTSMAICQWMSTADAVQAAVLALTTRTMTELSTRLIAISRRKFNPTRTVMT